MFCVPLMYHNTAQLAKPDVDKGLKRILQAEEDQHDTSDPQRDNTQSLSGFDSKLTTTVKLDELEILRSFLMYEFFDFHPF